MHGHLSRLAAPGVSLVASAAFFLLLATAFAHPSLAVTFKWLAGALLVAGAVAPLQALFGLMCVLPFAASMERAFAGQPGAAAATDGLVLAFLAGASLRVAWPRTTRPARLLAPAAVLLAAVLTSTLEELSVIQRVTPRVSIAPDLLRYLTTDYWTTTVGYPVVHHAIRWSSWLVLAVYAERLVSTSVDGRWPVGVWCLSGAVGAVLTVAAVLPIVNGPEPMGALRALLENGRVSALQPDLNAAGSYFALFLLPAIVIAVRRRARWMLATVAPLVTFAFVAARSRAAFVAAILVTCGAWAVGFSRAEFRAGRQVRQAVVVALAAAIGAVMLVIALVVVTGRSNVAAGTALQFRVEMTHVAAEAIGRSPIFGVGLGDYIRTTRRFIDADVPMLQQSAPNGENAHNNVLQIAAELGVPAALAFLWLVVPMAARGFVRRDSEASPELQGMALGLAAFLVSALLGHPLLVTQVGAAFFIALGVTAGLVRAGPSRSDASTTVTVSVVAFYVASLFWRVT